MTIKTKCVYYKAEPEDGYRICIMRFLMKDRPAFNEFREHQDRWMPILAPSPLLLQSWKYQSISWDTFVERYNKEISNNPNAMMLVKELHDRSKNETITLLCNENDRDPHCHRYLLKPIIENYPNTVTTSSRIG